MRINITPSVIELRKKNPCLSFADIGRIFGVSRERIRQIIKKQGLQTKRFRQKYICLNCGKEIISRDNKLYCNNKCRYEYSMVSCACDICGKLFKRNAKGLVWFMNNIGYSHVYCSRRCLGIYNGTHYGFGRKRYAEG